MIPERILPSWDRCFLTTARILTSSPGCGHHSTVQSPARSNIRGSVGHLLKLSIEWHLQRLPELVERSVQWPQDAADRRRTLFVVISSNIVRFFYFIYSLVASTVNLLGHMSAAGRRMPSDHRHKTPQQYYCIMSCGVVRRFVMSCGTVLRQRYWVEI